MHGPLGSKDGRCERKSETSRYGEYGILDTIWTHWFCCLLPAEHGICDILPFFALVIKATLGKSELGK